MAYQPKYKKQYNPSNHYNQQPVVMDQMIQQQQPPMEHKKQQKEPIKNKQDQNLRVYANNIEKFLKDGRGWFPQKLPKNLLESIEKIKPGPLQK